MSGLKLHELLPGDLWVAPFIDSASMVIQADDQKLIVIVCWSTVHNPGRLFSEFGCDMTKPIAGYVVRWID